MRYVFHPEALTEYSEAVEYYLGLQGDIAQAFINAVEEAVNKIREDPGRWQTIDGNIRRCLTKKFPYAILYKIEKDYILILAVMHCNRRPGYWKERIK